MRSCRLTAVVGCCRHTESVRCLLQAPDGRKMTNADYINDSSKSARVTVTGRINTVGSLADVSACIQLYSLQQTMRSWCRTVAEAHPSIIYLGLVISTPAY